MEMDLKEFVDHLKSFTDGISEANSWRKKKERKLTIIDFEEIHSRAKEIKISKQEFNDWT